MIGWFKGKTQEVVVQGALGVSVSANSIAMTQVILDKKPKVLVSSIVATSDQLNTQQALEKFISSNKLIGIPVTYVLGTADYQISKEVCTDVTETAALVQEKFILPAVRATDNAEMMYRISVKKPLIKQIATMVNSTKAILHCVDIPELTICRLASCCEEISSGALLLAAEQDSVLLIFYGFGQIYFTRKIAMSSAEALSEEIQRSCDYFVESSMTQDVDITKIAIMPTSQDTFELQQHLKNSLEMEILNLNLADYITDVASENSNHLSVAAALRGIAPCSSK